MKPKIPKAPTVLRAGEYDIADLSPHKDHYHTKAGEKVYLEKSATGAAGAPEGTVDAPPTEEDVMGETISAQRQYQKRARQKMGSAFTMLQRGSGSPYRGSNQLV